MLSIKTDINGKITELEHAGGQKEIIEELVHIVEYIADNYAAAGEPDDGWFVCYKVGQALDAYRMRYSCYGEAYK